MAAAHDHVGALRLSRDVEVLTSLGLHLSALADDAAGRVTGRIAQATSAAALGHVATAARDAAELWDRVRGVEKSKLALEIGRWDPMVALDLARDVSRDVRAALAVHAGRLTDAAILLAADGPCARAADEMLLRATLHAHRAEHGAARRLTNAAFRLHGLAAPLADTDVPIALASFASDAPEPARAPDADVSVIMPVRSMASTVETAMQSVLGQTGVRVELIVVDDASSDDTATRVAALANRDERVRLMRTGRPSGTYAARNLGLGVATGPFLAFNDADDWSHPERLSRQLAPLRADPGVMATESRMVRIDGQGRFVARRVYPLIRANRSSLVVRRSVLDRLGAFEDVAFGADEEFTARIVACFGAGAVRRLALPLAVGLQSDTSLTGAATTGISSLEGTRQRIAYRQTWMTHHASFAAQRVPSALVLPKLLRRTNLL